MSSEEKAPEEAVVSQGTASFRQNMPEWIKQLPRLNFPKQDPNFQLIDMKQLDEYLKGVSPAAYERLKEDMQFLDKELLRLFRDRDYEAKLQQNRYRVYQIGYMLLAAAATLVGSLFAVAQTSAREAVPILGFLETLIALLTTYLATIAGREQPLPLWLSNRRKAESLRREYFRFLMDLPPYDTLEGYERRRMLSMRAADINRGFFPEIVASKEQ